MTDLGDPAAAERRRTLLGIKLKALVSGHLGCTIDDAASGFGVGSALVTNGAAWLIADGDAKRTLGPAVAWAIRNGATSVDLIAERDGALLARRAQGFDFPINLWFAQDRTLLPVVAEPADIAGAPPADHLALIDLIEQAGAQPQIERGVVTGEVRGLEVCRVVDEPTTGNFAELSDVPSAASVAPDDAELAERLAGREADGVILEVGVGANDREAFQMLHGHLPTVDALAGVVGAVTKHRSAAAGQHPLNRMAPERFLRWQVEQDPSIIGLTEITQVDPPLDRLSMKHNEPCVSTALDQQGRQIAVVFSAGVDLDLVAFVADVIVDLADDIERILVVVAPKDLLAITQDMAKLLTRPVDFVTLGDG